MTTLTGNPATSSTQLDSPVLSAYLEQGTWTVLGVLLVDSAGNSDAVAPELVSITVLTLEVTPSTCSARISFGVSATDNLAGVEKVRLDLVGPSGQIITLWGNYGSTHPTTLSAQIDGPILNTLLETGTWTIDAVDVYDNAGNHTTRYTDDLVSRDLTATVTVN